MLAHAPDILGADDHVAEYDSGRLPALALLVVVVEDRDSGASRGSSAVEHVPPRTASVAVDLAVGRDLRARDRVGDGIADARHHEVVEAGVTIRQHLDERLIPTLAGQAASAEHVDHHGLRGRIDDLAAEHAVFRELPHPSVHVRLDAGEREIDRQRGDHLVDPPCQAGEVALRSGRCSESSAQPVHVGAVEDEHTSAVVVPHELRFRFVHIFCTFRTKKDDLLLDVVRCE